MIYKLVLWSVYFALPCPIAILQKLPQSPRELWFSILRVIVPRAKDKYRAGTGFVGTGPMLTPQYISIKPDYKDYYQSNYIMQGPTGFKPNLESPMKPACSEPVPALDKSEL